jgi:hypothetical protein
MIILFFYAVFIGFVEGFRMPNLWSINYYIPSFFDGFYRRSLGGTLLWIFGDIRFNYYFVVFFQFLILFFLIYFVYRAIRYSHASILLATIYFLSPLGGYLFHEVGYIEQLLYFLSFVSIYLLLRLKIFASIILLIASMFFHEMALLTTLPILLFYIFLNDHDIKFAVKFIFLPAMAFLIVFLFFQTVSTEALLTLKDNIKLNSSYPIRDGYFSIFTNEFFGSRMRFYYTLDNLFLGTMLAVLLLLIILLLNYFQSKFLIQFSAMMAILAPLFLGFFGWDTDRWIFLGFTNFFIISYFIYHKFFNSSSHSKLNYLVLIIFFTAFLSMPDLKYFDGYSPRNEFSKQTLKQIYTEVRTIPKR